jgi:hypothetical protein
LNDSEFESEYSEYISIEDDEDISSTKESNETAKYCK